MSIHRDLYIKTNESEELFPTSLVKHNDPARRGTIPWPMRLNIIKGITKGLVYIFHDSRLTIIHRDLKVSNVFLDRDMTPKISDFGLAREFKYDVEVKTRRVAGTHGYMPPEYIENGYYSTKSDVFSFGVLALEIVSGERNSTYQHPIYDIGLVGYAWRIWEEGKPIELLDPEIEKQGDLNEVLGVIHVGILAIGADTYTLLEDSRAVEAIRWDESWLRVDFRSLGVDIVLFVVVDGFDGFRSETGHG
ncbi:hypothetical protein T459_05749 [Capsicum annuum]|uniref:Protein kinase domain-containing protein n=1 Tax=Capsicum annuum TaxID=4072 RepID=A0A2G3A8R1_CAPAN|nr:hypothetical protein T459_05749 [Capsicum annuum]